MAPTAVPKPLPMACWAAAGLAWLLGLAALHQFARLPAAPLQLLAVAMPLFAASRWRRLPAGWRGMALVLAVALAAFAQGAWRAEQRLADALDPAWEGRDLQLVGRIDSLPQRVAGQGGLPGWRFEYVVEQAQDAGAVPDAGMATPPRVPQRLLLTSYLRAEAGRPAPRWQPGERWALVARLRQPHGGANPQGWDYELHLFERGLRATGVLRSAERIDDGGWMAAWLNLDRWRLRMRDAIARQLGGRDDGGAAAGVIAGLSLGEQAAIRPADWALFRATGVAHLMAISGLHITMFAWGAAALAAALWRRSARACLWLPAPTAALWAGVACAALYAGFAGWGVPAQRTVWMLASLALLRQLGLRWPWPLALLASACVVTAIDPWAITQAGFWLSFVAVALLMASSGDGHAPLRPAAQLRAALRNQWVATLGLAPLSLLFFQQLSAVGLLANLVAIPLVSLLITPLALAGAVLPLLWELAALCIDALRWGLGALAALPWALWFLPVAPAWAQAAGLLGAALLVLPLPVQLRVLGPLLLAPLLWPAVPAPEPGQFELHAPDVGQGSAVLIRTARHSLLYDAGPQYAPGVDAGERVLLPLLRGLGLARLDMLLLSHGDQDHIGGAARLLQQLPADELLSSLPATHVLQAMAGRQRRCERGQSWQWDGVAFAVMHPAVGDYERVREANALSCVLRVVSADGRAALLTGDIAAAQEAELLQHGRAALRSEWLLLPHHGSAGSSSAALLQAVAPRWALAQAGYLNRFGHPALAVRARLQAMGVVLHSSADCGALRWDSAAESPSCWRQQQQRYWRRLPWPGAAASGDAGPELGSDAPADAAMDSAADVLTASP